VFVTLTGWLGTAADPLAARTAPGAAPDANNRSFCLLMDESLLRVLHRLQTVAKDRGAL
jgi:hypothetical protein